MGDSVKARLAWEKCVNALVINLVRIYHQSPSLLSLLTIFIPKTTKRYLSD